MAIPKKNSLIREPGSIKSMVLLVVLFGIGFLINSCQQDDLLPDKNNIEFNSILSDYNIFQGAASDLIPSDQYQLYELSTPLFSDYSEKQRLIKIPSGQKLTAQRDGLPDFPDGTIIVKTFYYYKDKRDTTKGRKIIETRLEIKSNSIWNVATYMWNEEQTDARLITSGLNKTIHWIDSNGTGKVISYHIPANRECATCHNYSNDIIPIGPKLRNLNIEVIRNESRINQLEYFKHIGILEAADLSSISALPNWNNVNDDLDKRARAYLDVNCAHCHSANGNAANTNLFFNYEKPYENTGIPDHKSRIIKQIETGQMPRIGTTIIDEEGVALIKSYIHSLK